MKKEFSLINAYLKQGDTLNKNVSKSPVIWHLAHSVKVINSISKALRTSNPEDYKPRFNLVGTIVLTAGSIPRGKGKAPKKSQPGDTIDLEELKKYIGIAREEFSNLKKLDPKSHFSHPFFGQLNLKKSKKFIKIHTRHHLKIIKDILQ